MKLILTQFPIGKVSLTPKTKKAEESFTVETLLQNDLEERQWDPQVRHSQLAQRESLRNELKRRIPQNKWSLDVLLEYRLYTGSSRQKLKIMDVTVSGRLLHELHQMLLFVNLEESLNIQAGFLNPSQSTSDPLQFSLLPKGQKENSEFSCHSTYLAKNRLIPTRLESHDSTNPGDVTLTVWLEIEHFMAVGPVLPSLSVRNRRILKDKRLCDFELVSGDGTRISCHKIFLVESPVLAAMVDPQGKFEECQKNEANLEGMSTEGINALLEYLYCGVILNCLKSDKICLELFQAGHRYNLPGLEEVTKTILLEKECQWFGVDTVLEMYQFVRNYTGEKGKELRDKVVQVLLEKQDLESEGSELFSEIFSNDLAKELFKLVLAVKK